MVSARVGVERMWTMSQKVILFMFVFILGFGCQFLVFFGGVGVCHVDWETYPQ